MIKQARVLISGFVQGVGFRHFIKNKALEFGLTGWVRNLPDGRLETVLQGSKEKINEMIELCKKGPLLSEIEDVEVEWQEEDKQFSDFLIQK